MSRFDLKTTRAMQSVLEEVCSHIPKQSSESRTFVASKILECAGDGNTSRDALLAAGRQAVIERFGSIDALRRSL
jgi:hypothetical protein